MKKISIIEVQSALKSLSFEVQSSQGCEAIEIISNFIAQKREEQIKNGTLITNN